MGFISSLVTGIPYKYWAFSQHHHAHQGQLDTRTIGDVTLLTVKEYQELTSWKIEIQNLSFCSCDVYYSGLLHFYSQQNSFYQI
jgi:hypothetical protein